MPSDTGSRIFRQKALDRLVSPDTLDTVMTVTQPRNWLALGAVALLLAAVIVWGVAGRLRVEVAADGTCVRGRPVHIIAPVAGQIVELLVHDNMHVERGQPVARVRVGPLDNIIDVVDVPSTEAGRIAAVEARLGELVVPGRPLFDLELADPLEAIVFVNAREAREVGVGAPALVLPAIYDRAEYGYIRGAVASVGTVPASRDALRATLDDERLADRLAASGQLIAVHVRLTPDPATPSGVRWSSSPGPAAGVPSGLTCSASLLVAERRPITLVVPVLQRVFGG